MSSQGMAVSNYKADEKEAARNRKKLLALIKQPQNNVCADCPAKRACRPPVLPSWLCVSGGQTQRRRERARRVGADETCAI